MTPPRPIPSRWSERFWEALNEDGTFLLQRCADCREYAGYPKVICPACHSRSLEWEPASGRGTVYTYTTVLANPPSTFVEQLPYTIAIVTLEEGPRFLSRLVGVEPEDVRIDMPVQLSVQSIGDGPRLPLFEPASPGP